MSIKVVILAGGLGSRLSEETGLKPKPMVEIGGRPILWHIMKLYSHYGFREFIVCLGYKGYLIKEYFVNYFLHQSDVTIDIEHNEVQIHNTKTEPWKVTLVDTGLHTMTGGRIKRIEPYIENHTFMLTYGDGVGDIELKRLYEFHKSQGRLATLTAVKPFGRFGAIEINKINEVVSFKEKPEEGHVFVNGGFFVVEPEVLKYIQGDATSWEKEPLERLANNRELTAFQHNGFWMCMDTQRDKNELELLWSSGKAFWKVWKD